MATVLISKAVISDIELHVNRMRDDALRMALGPETSCDLAVINQPLRFLELHAWGAEHAHWAVDMPEKWKKRSKRIDFAVTKGDVRLSISCENVNAATWFPPDFSSYHDHPVSFDELVEAQSKHPEAMLILEQFERNVQRRALVSKWNTTRAEVVEYFRACPSLNKALQLHPAMQMYVPKKLLDKLAQAVEPKAKRELPTIDSATLAAQAVEVSLARSIHGGA